jgi:hypothetical protein
MGHREDDGQHGRRERIDKPLRDKMRRDVPAPVSSPVRNRSFTRVMPCFWNTCFRSTLVPDIHAGQYPSHAVEWNHGACGPGVTGQWSKAIRGSER